MKALEREAYCDNKIYQREHLSILLDYHAICQSGRLFLLTIVFRQIFRRNLCKLEIIFIFGNMNNGRLKTFYVEFAY